MDAFKADRIIVKGSRTEWIEVLEDLEQAEDEWGDEINDGTKYLIGVVRNALK